MCEEVDRKTMEGVWWGWDYELDVGEGRRRDEARFACVVQCGMGVGGETIDVESQPNQVPVQGEGGPGRFRQVQAGNSNLLRGEVDDFAMVGEDEERLDEKIGEVQSGFRKKRGVRDV